MLQFAGLTPGGSIYQINVTSDAPLADFPIQEEAIGCRTTQTKLPIAQ
jgi:hypothetical protein